MNNDETFVYWRKKKVSQITGLSFSSIYRAEKEGMFPKRYQLSKRNVAYRSDEIIEWMNSRTISQDVLDAKKDIK